MSSVKKLFSQTGIYGLGTILPRFLNYLLTPLYTYLFTNPADYGINAEVYAYISFLNIIFTYGMETAFFHFSNKYANARRIFNNAYSLIISTTVLFSLILLAISDNLKTLLHYQHAIYIYWAVGIIASDALLSIPFAYLRQQQKAIHFSLLKISNVVINIALNLFFFLICKQEHDARHNNFFSSIYNPDIGIGYSFLSNLMANIASILMLLPILKKFRFTIDIDIVKDMLKYTLPLVIVGLAGMVNETFDRIVLKYLLPADVAQSAQGIYGACYKISILMTIFIQAYRYAAEPFFFNIFKDSDARITYAKTTDVFITAGLLIWLFTLLNLPVIQYFIGSSYRVGLNIVPILLTANLCLGIYFNLSFWYKLTGQTHIGAYVTIIGAFITLIINFIFVPRYSYVASAWATLAAYSSMMILAYLLGQKYYKINYPINKILMNTVIAAVIYVLSQFIPSSSPIIQILLNNILLIIYVIYLIQQYKILPTKKSQA